MQKYILSNDADSDVFCGDHALCLATARNWADNPQVQESLVKDVDGLIHLGEDGGVAMTMTPLSGALAALTPNTACMVDDGANTTIYARPRAEVLAELCALPEGDTYSPWCSEHDYILSTGTGDRGVDMIAEALGLPEIVFSEGRWI